MAKKKKPNQDDIDPIDEGPSKSELKRQQDHNKGIGKQLLEMSAKEIAKLNMPDELAEAVHTGRRIRHGNAKRRQLSYITRLVGQDDAEHVRDAVANVEAKRLNANQHFKILENIRDQLLETDADNAYSIIQALPDADAQHINGLVRNARREAQREQPPKSSRKLFQYLRSLHE